MISLSEREVQGRQRRHSPPQRKTAIPESNRQNSPPKTGNELSQGPSRVGLAILLLVNLFIFAGIIYSIA